MEDVLGDLVEEDQGAVTQGGGGQQGAQGGGQ